MVENQLSGQLPEGLGRLKQLRYFWAQSNHLSGTLPNSYGQLTNLFVFAIGANYISGQIPGYISNWKRISRLAISDSFNIQFPVDADLPFINTLIMRNCSITGQIPEYIGNNMASLKHLASELKIAEQCRDKSLYDSLYINCGGEPASINGSNYVADNETKSYYVSNSSESNWAYSCSGTFLSEDANSSNYQKNITCGISNDVYATARICPVSLKYYGFCLRQGNYTVTLYFAEIVYSEREDHSILGERVFDVYIQGERVETNFNPKVAARDAKKDAILTYNASVKEDHTLRIHLYWAGKGSFLTPPATNGPLISAISVTSERKGHNGGKLSAPHITLIAVASVTFSLFVILLCLSQMGWLERERFPDEEKRIELPNGPVSVGQIIDATNNFNTKKEIGRGEKRINHGLYFPIFFPVSYFLLAQIHGQIVAVKKLSSPSKQKIQEFNTEVNSLSSYKHENVVRLYGGYSGKELHLLIYEYMEHKSIADALFETRSRLKLDWKARREICLGIAKGLKYIHGESRLRMVHRDIKAQNILLGGTDGNLTAKISDFGLAMLCEEGNENMVSKVAGTHGYLAPEYAMRGILSQKADVYSFGVLLLEIVSGKSNAVSRPTQETVFLLDTAYVYNKEGRLADLVDKDLSGCYDFTQAMRILNLAMMCTSQTPTLRPTMSEVVSVLQDEKTVEQVFVAPPTDSSSMIMAGASLSSSAEISSTSTGVPSSELSSYFMIKENIETKN
ncbi:hypothetical protein RJ639_030899 [Escallonia herrerae]|uniref:non-specific serine/threonine protein kinase n=1 Tax=Escallonia herrerae TaxID=1293975 RepID=A0AA88X1K0_9ASTE|nr:hypothetical protein RJ639_030899 [Escallonia herrerae]